MRLAWVVAVTLGACGSVHNNDKHDASIDGPKSIDAPMIDGMTCAANPSGLQGRWRAEMDANDEAVPAHNGVAVGASFTYVPGKHGFAFQLDGSTNAVTIDDGDALWPSGSFSLEAWVKTTSTGNVISKYQCSNACPANSNAYWGVSVGGGGHPSFQLRTDASGVIISATDGQHSVGDGQWHHLVGVRDSVAQNALLYVDGALGATLALAADEQGPMTNTDGSEDLVVIGASITGGTTTLNGFLNGAIDDVSYYATALSAAQVAAIYAAPDGECH